MNRGELVVRWNRALLRWQVYRIGSDAARAEFDTKARALAYGIARASRTGEVLHVQDRNGRVIEKRQMTLRRVKR